MDTLNNWFWTERIWLPVGYTWKDYESTDTLKKANIRELYYLPIFVMCISLLRYAFEGYLALPFCKFLGISDDVPAEENKICESIYTTVTKYPKNKEMETIAKEANMTRIEVNVWFRKRRNRAKQSVMRKSTETCWRAFVYFILFIYGSILMWRRGWLFDYSNWLPNYHKHEFTTDLKVYYFVEMSFYFALLFSQCVDVKRKDFVQQFIHHVSTLTLLLGSYILSYYRFGAIILYIHDTADVWLECAKLSNYAKIQKVCDFLFGVFGITFFITRLVYYPSYVAYGYFHNNTYKNSIIMKTMVCLCFVLLFLNFYWGYLILRLAYKLIVKGGGVEKDSRSDSEVSDEE